MPKADFYKLLVKLKEVQFSIMKDDEKHQILMTEKQSQQMFDIWVEKWRQINHKNS